MPANRRRQDREEKRAELLTEARRLFIEDGYEATSMAALAKAAGVAGNTIYWYFADKDDVLVAVLETVLSDALAEYQQVATAPLEEQLSWVVRQLQQMQRLVNTVHTRAAHSPAVDEWHTGFHRTAEGLFRATLEELGVDSTDIEAEIKIGVFTVEGLLTHSLDEEQQQAICRRLAEQWTRR
ncbi:AcrR family transcriptional regulator [Nocardioides luteus]|uniref:TetR family transcriptional regulator n=1 Tax=Nocardioides luteus TaxID=1844 RepID=A0ABQ5SW32_9ACTN|nr:TetR/AcrR family transcriptional regulator [Nocardioides luteus]MDR7309438.1 AcrR family transcriptional regulator [Nocardioides luteus]GGR51234.1 TetR family transcriptional regulator [Nocardioides luteus]GLJ67845.1 TetR family transcriptional regulator [Nocardioides luteus]